MGISWLIVAKRLLECTFLSWDVFFFFQAEDGIRDDLVTGVQTCALPIFIAACGCTIPANVVIPKSRNVHPQAAMTTFAGIARNSAGEISMKNSVPAVSPAKIGRASCRERV